GSPEERMVVNELAGLTVFTIAHSLRPKWTDRLGMAVDTALPDIKISSLQFQGRVGLYAGNRGYIGLDHKGRHHLDKSTDQDYDQCNHHKHRGFAFQPTVCRTFPGDQGLQSRGLSRLISHQLTALHGFDQIDRHQDHTSEIKHTPYR